MTRPGRHRSPREPATTAPRDLSAIPSRVWVAVGGFVLALCGLLAAVLLLTAPQAPPEAVVPPSGRLVPSEAVVPPSAPTEPLTLTGPQRDYLTGLARSELILPTQVALYLGDASCRRAATANGTIAGFAADLHRVMPQLTSREAHALVIVAVRALCPIVASPTEEGK